MTNPLPSATPTTTNTATDLLGDLSLNLNPVLPSQPPKPVGGVLGQISVPTTTPTQLWGAFQTDPLAVLNDLFVPKDKIQPSTLPPLQVLNKNGISVSLHFTQNAPAANVAVVVISAINTNTLPVAQFQIQVAVPKVMRVKLQPPTATDLAPFNPMLPPANVSQIMLLANPTKDTIRLKYRISWMLNGLESVETGEVSNFPAL
jgi:ADP-ribosylation factor-binding protein GGA